MNDCGERKSVRLGEGVGEGHPKGRRKCVCAMNDGMSERRGSGKIEQRVYLVVLV